MIKKNYQAKAEKPLQARQQLPVGAYEAVIKSAKVESGSYGDTLVIAFDITAGDYKDFFAKDFDANQNEDKKWRGTFRIGVPQGDGDPQWKIRNFNNFIYAVEDSNAGYHFDWEESHLKGKAIGVNYQNKEWEFNGKSGWTTVCGQLESVNDVRAGKCRVLKDRALKKAEETTSFVDAAASADDLPF